MLADINKLTTDSVMGGEVKGGWCRLGAHMRGLEGVGVQKTDITEFEDRAKEIISQRGQRIQTIFFLWNPFHL